MVVETLEKATIRTGTIAREMEVAKRLKEHYEEVISDITLIRVVLVVSQTVYRYNETQNRKLKRSSGGAKRVKLENYEVHLPNYSIGDRIYDKIGPVCESYGKKVLIIGGRRLNYSG